LRNTFGFEGLIFTDALGMKGVSGGFRPGETEARALLAGNDILLMPDDVPRAISHIHREVKKGAITEKELDQHVRRVLFAKSWAGLNGQTAVKIDSLREDLKNPFFEVEKAKLIRTSITLLTNRGGVVPFRYPESYRIASLAVGSGKPDEFSKTLTWYTSVDTFFLSKDRGFTGRDTLINQLNSYNTLIVSIQETSQYAGRNYGIHPGTVRLIENMDFKGNLVLVFFGNPYGLLKLNKLDKFNSVVLAYEDTDEVKFLTAQGIFGAFELNGRIPVAVSGKFPLFGGIQSAGIDRLSYGFPEEAGLSSIKLARIDSIVEAAIRMKAIPGCQVLIARRGQVVLNKGYGWHSYDRKQRVKESDLYDLASLTKIAATLPSLMKLEGEGKFSSDHRLGQYLILPDTCNKGDLNITDILTHQSGLQSWIPFYYSTLQPIDTSEKLLDTKYSDQYPFKLGDKAYANRNLIYIEGIYSHKFSVNYPVQVADNLFIRKDYKDTIYNRILNSELSTPVYRYSDLGYYLFHQIIEKLTDTLLYPYVYHNFYSRLGAMRIGYLPLNRFSENEITPTENDVIYRKQLLRGYVHDPGAAMLGGIAGHAGLFSNANDLAKLMQVYLNGGHYGGREFLKKEIIDKYTTRIYSDNGNRRALGFDKPEPDSRKKGPVSCSATLSSYGHTGFTGTIAWMDPEYQLIYIFLSNRLHPNQYNAKLVSENIRTKVQEAIYEAITD
ncbi:MAG: serine hydrolase, partial [Bacteroidales bacterium]|nr:serine hydrolase [Bacteroidales bacterium]